MTSRAESKPGWSLDNRWVFLGILTTIRLTLGFQFQTVGSSSSFLREDLAISHAQIGTLIGLFMLPCVFIALPSGFLSKRFGDRRMASFGLLFMGLGATAFVLSDSYGLAVGARLVSGIGSVLLNVTMTKMVLDRFSDHGSSTAMGIMAPSWPAGIGIGLVSQGWLAETYSWQLVMSVSAVTCGIGLVAFLTFIRIPNSNNDLPGSGRLFSLTRNEIILVSILGLAWAAFNAGFAIHVSFTPDVLIDKGMSIIQAGALIGVGMWITLISIPVSGYLVERFKRIQMAILVLPLLLALTLGAFPYVTIPLVLSVLMGLWLGPPPGPLLALQSAVLKEENRAPGVGIFYTFFYVAMAVGPAAAGMSREVTNDASTPVFIASGLFAFIVVFVIVLRVQAKRYGVSLPA
jgi:MFS family permease